MNYGQGIKGRLVIGSATVSHVLAWAAFLWIVLWPHAYQGVSAKPVSVDGIPATEVVEARHSASFIEVDGYRPLVLLFIPVLATGLALIFLLTRTKRRTMNAPVLWALAAVLLVFSGLGYYSFGILYAPAALALIVAAAFFGLGRGLPRLNDG